MSTQAGLRRYTVDEVVERGQAVYENGVRDQVETKDNLGKLLLLDIETGHYVIGDDRIELARRLRAENPDAMLYGLKIGYPAATAIGTTLRPLSQMSEAEIQRLERGHSDESSV